jgi:hypothetical protein
MTTHKRVVVEAPRKRRSPELLAIRVLVLADEDPGASLVDLDEDRKASYDRGDFSFVGIRAEAQMTVDGIVQTIVSGGLWGIESDADAGYIQEVAGDEYNDLRKILKTLGVPTSELPNEVDVKQIEWRV